MNYCECEHSSHFSSESGCHPYGKENPATVKVSPSWTICKDCESTMGVAEGSYAGLEVATVGPYAGKAWHVVTPA